MAKLTGNITRDSFKADKATEPVKTEFKTMKEFHEANKDLIGINGKIKTGMTFSAPKQTNVKPYSTQLDRFRAANRAAHLQCNAEMLNDDVRIQYTGKALNVGAEIWAVCKDGLDVLPDGPYVTKSHQVFAVKAGRVAEVVTDKFKASTELREFAFQADVDRAHERMNATKIK